MNVFFVSPGDADMRQHDGLGFRHPELFSGSPDKRQQSSNPGDADMRQHDGLGVRHY